MSGVLSAILPVFFVAGAGFLLRRCFTLDARTLSTLNIFIFIPALVFNSLSKSGIAWELLGRYAVANVLIVVVMAPAMTLIARARRLDSESTAAFLMTMFMNLGNFGLPVALFAFGEEGLVLAVVVMVCGTLVQNVMGIYYAQRSRHSAYKAALMVFTYPMVYAVAAALLFQHESWRLPEVLDRAVALTADAAIPVQLMILGIKLAETRLEVSPEVFNAVALRLVAAPLAAVPIAWLCGLHGLAAKIYILQMSGPTAVSMAVFGVQFNLKPAYLASVVSWTFLLSLFTVSAVLYVLMRVAV